MTVQAERLNFLRFISHFRAVHRGASFAGLRTTSVRKLLPEYVFLLFVWQYIVIHMSIYYYFSCFPVFQCCYADLGVFFALFTHLMGSRVGC